MWRTRRIVKELKSLSSVDSLVAYEEELRSLLISQEALQHTRVMRQGYTAECYLCEREELFHSEHGARRRIYDEAFRFGCASIFTMALCLEEESDRSHIWLAQRIQRGIMMNDDSRMQLLFSEMANRNLVMSAEGCCREEMRQRRLVELGFALQREIIRQNHRNVHRHSVEYSRRFSDAVRCIELSETKDRQTIQALYGLHTANIQQAAQDDFCGALHHTIVHCSVSDDRRRSERLSDGSVNEIDATIANETRIRHLVEESEEAERTLLRQDSLIGWRGVYQQLTTGSHLLRIVANVELFTRSNLTSQERLSYRDIRDREKAARHVLMERSLRYKRLCEDFFKGAKSIWHEESQAINAIARSHHYFAETEMALQATLCLRTLEESERRGILGAEALGRYLMQRKYSMDDCECLASSGVRLIQEQEEEGKRLLQQQFINIRYILPLAQLMDNETSSRALIEVDEVKAVTQLQCVIQSALSLYALALAIDPLVRLELLYRERVATAEERGRQALCRLQLALNEVHVRLQLQAEERTDRFLACRQTTEEMEVLHRSDLMEWASSDILLTFFQTLAFQEHQARAVVAAAEADAFAGALSQWSSSSLSQPTRSSVEMDVASQPPPPFDGAAMAKEMFPDELGSQSDGESVTGSMRSDNVSYDVGFLMEDVFDSFVAQLYLSRDAVHFDEVMERRVIYKFLADGWDADATIRPPYWSFHSISILVEEQNAPLQLNLWHSGSAFDISLPLKAEETAVPVGKRSISFYTALTSPESIPLDCAKDEGMLFALVLDARSSMIASASVVLDEIPMSQCSICLPLADNLGYIRLC